MKTEQAVNNGKVGFIAEITSDKTVIQGVLKLAKRAVLVIGLPVIAKTAYDYAYGGSPIGLIASLVSVAVLHSTAFNYEDKVAYSRYIDNCKEKNKLKSETTGFKVETDEKWAKALWSNNINAPGIW